MLKNKQKLDNPRTPKAIRCSRNAMAAFLNAKEEKNTETQPEHYASEKISSGLQYTINTAVERGRRYTRKAREALRTIQRTRNQSSFKASRKVVNATGRTVKATAQSAKATAKTAKVTVDTTRKATIAVARAAKAASRAAIQGVKLAIKAVIAAVKAIATAVKGLSAAIAAGGWVVLVIVLVVAAVAALLCSPFGIFYSNETTENHTPATIMAELRQELSDKIDAIKQDHPEASEVTITYEGSEDGTAIQNGADILAVFAVQVAVAPGNPTEVVTLDEAKETILRQIYWDMTLVTYTMEPMEEEPPVNDPSPSSTPEPPPVRLDIYVDCLSYDEMIAVYGFNADQVEVLEELMHPRYQQLFMSLLGIEMPDELTADEIAEIRNSLPDDFIISRNTIAEKAQSLAGRVHYFWGGKSYAIGWDDRWGNMRTVTAEGSPSTGMTRALWPGLFWLYRLGVHQRWLTQRYGHRGIRHQVG